MTSVSATSPVSNPLSTGTTSAQSSADAQQDRFLKLLVAQLHNQDPMNPMDNAQMTSQMAQINTVSGINQLNETVKSLSTKFSCMQTLQGASLVGRDVLVESNTLSVNAGVAKGAIEVPVNATQVKVQIVSPGGQILDTLDLGALTQGRHAFTWNAPNYSDAQSPTFNVIATAKTGEVAATSYAQDTIVSVGTSAAGMSLELKGRSPVAYDAVQSIL